MGIAEQMLRPEPHPLDHIDDHGHPLHRVPHMVDPQDFRQRVSHRCWGSMEARQS